MKIDFSSYSEIGGRVKNEDAILTYDAGKSILAIVADGLGGHGYGEVASKITTTTLATILQNCPVSSEVLQMAIQATNKAIIQQQDEKPGMKSTIATLWIAEGVARAAHVGDSRIYHFRDNKIIYQSMDHSLSQLDVLMGKMSYDDIRKSSNRNILTRALGSDLNLKAEIAMLDVQHNDSLLVCSDGFWELIIEAEMLECLSTSTTSSEWLDKMKKIVNKRNASFSDNHSAIALMITSDNGGN